MPLHTQREEDIKQFPIGWVNGDLDGVNMPLRFQYTKDFISNIYIKIAEMNVAYWQGEKEKLQKEYRETHIEVTGGALAIAIRELELAQEELNKLK